MRKRLVYICSPCRGEVEKNIIKAQGYCREAVELFPDVIPIAPHVYFTQFLNELEPAERAEGMEMGIALLDMCSEIWVYGMDNPTNVFPSLHVIVAVGCAFAQCRAKKLGSPILCVLWWLIALSICASTVLIKQHSVLDIFAAVPVCCAGWLLFFRK